MGPWTFAWMWCLQLPYHRTGRTAHVFTAQGVTHGLIFWSPRVAGAWLPAASIGTEKTMTAKDVTGFYAVFSARKSGNFLHILGHFFTELYRKPGEKGKNPLEKIQKIQWRRRPEIADFCPLSRSNVP